MSSNKVVPYDGYDRSVTTRNLLRQFGIQKYLDMEGVTEVTINRPGELLTETAQGWTSYEAPLCSLDNLKILVNALSVFQEGDELSSNNPIQGVRLPTGERGHIVIPPACEPHTVSITIRKPSGKRFTIEDYIQSGRFAEIHDASEHKHVPEGVRLKQHQLDLMAAKNQREMKRFFELAIQHKLNFLMVGATGSGKTTVTKAIVDMVPPDTRIITIEDTHELDLPLHKNKVHLFYSENVSPKHIVKSCLRMKPDRVFLTELRGDETWDYLSLLNTGHPGSITTVHANDCLTAFHRVATLVKQSDVGVTLDFNFILREVMTTIDVVLFFDRTYLTQMYYDPVKQHQLLGRHI